MSSAPNTSEQKSFILWKDPVRIPRKEIPFITGSSLTMTDNRNNAIHSKNVDISQAKALLEKRFDFVVTGWTLMSAGSVNLLYRVSGNVVIRISQRRSVRHIEQEVSLTELLREGGFNLVPEFIRTRDNECAVELASGIVASAYHYIEGEATQPLNESQFKILANT